MIQVVEKEGSWSAASRGEFIGKAGGTDGFLVVSTSIEEELSQDGFGSMEEAKECPDSYRTLLVLESISRASPIGRIITIICGGIIRRLPQMGEADLAEWEYRTAVAYVEQRGGVVYERLQAPGVLVN